MRGFYDVTLFDCPPFKMFDNEDDPRARDILIEKRFEPFSMKLWCRFAHTATAILDIGAHTGVYSLAAAALRPDMAIHAFEPNPYAIARLRLHKHLNGFAKINERRVALADRTGLAQLNWAIKPGGWIPSGSMIFEPPTLVFESDVVEGTTVDLAVAEPGDFPLIKIDVENAELMVFQGMEKMLQHRPVIILETFNPKRAAAITQMLGYYRFFRIDESQGLSETPAIHAAREEDASFNQLLLPREHTPLIEADLRT